MDALAFRLGNRLLGNRRGAAGLELTSLGPTLRFDCDAHDCADRRRLCGATLDGARSRFWHAVLPVPPAARCAWARRRGGGSAPIWRSPAASTCRTIWAAARTFTLGGFGGHAGRALRAGDVLHIARRATAAQPARRAARRRCVPPIAHDWEIGVLYGPHGAPDFFTADDIEMLFSARLAVHYHSSRTGVRLIGPKPQWARRTAARRACIPRTSTTTPTPSARSISPATCRSSSAPMDRASGGFVCPAVVVEAELWKLGQLKAGDHGALRAA